MGKALTVRTLETLKPGPTRREIPDGLVRGLFFIVQPSGAQSWACRYRIEGRPRKFTLGTYPAIGLTAARDLAKDALVSVARGQDPHALKKAVKAPPDRDIVERVVASFIERYARPNTRSSSAAESERVLNKEVVGRWKGRRLSSITRAEVHELLNSVVDRGSPIMANRLLAVFRKMCGWAVERGLIETSPCAGVNPPGAIVSRERVLSDDELRAVWKACDAIGYPFGPLIKLLILTGQRRDEVGAMTWAEVDLLAKLWALPRHRTKNGTEHTIPFSSQAMAILESLPHIGNGLVFTTNGCNAVSGFSRAKSILDKHVLGLDGATLPHWTLHDLRRTAATGMARLGVNIHVVEKVLNHTSGSFRGIVSVYQRHSFSDEKRHALDTWGAFIERLVSDEVGGNVVSITRAS